MFGQTSGMSSPRAKTGKYIRISVSPQTVVEILKTPSIVTPTEIKETLHQCIFMPLKPSLQKGEKIEHL